MSTNAHDSCRTRLTPFPAQIKRLPDGRFKVICGRHGCAGDVAVIDEFHSTEFRLGFVEDVNGVFRLDRYSQQQWDRARRREGVPWSRFDPVRPRGKRVPISRPMRQRYDPTGPLVQRIIDVDAPDNAPRRSFAAVSSFTFACPICGRESTADIAGLCADAGSGQAWPMLRSGSQFPGCFSSGVR
jgi:hypothetical protein